MVTTGAGTVAGVAAGTAAGAGILGFDCAAMGGVAVGVGVLLGVILVAFALAALGAGAGGPAEEVWGTLDSTTDNSSAVGVDFGGLQ